MITKSNIIVHELIGLHVKIASSQCKTYIGLEGDVIDETLHTLLIRRGDEVKRVPKKDVVFEFSLPNNETAVVRGSDLLNKPENRLKRGIHRLK